MTTDQQRLSAIQKRLAAITPAPWIAQEYCATPHDSGLSVIAVHEGQIAETPTRGQIAFVTTLAGASFDDPVACQANGEFIANAPTDIAYLLAQLSTPKPEALSREGGEFDEAAEQVKFEGHPYYRHMNFYRAQSGSYTNFETFALFEAWIARARIAHTELTEARKRIAELEVQLEPWALLMKSPYIHVVSASGFAGPNFEEMPANPDGYRRMVVAFYSRHDKRVDPGTMKYFIDYIDVMRALTAVAPIADEKADG